MLIFNAFCFVSDFLVFLKRLDTSVNALHTFVRTFAITESTFFTIESAFFSIASTLEGKKVLAKVCRTKMEVLAIFRSPRIEKMEAKSLLNNRF